MILIIVPPSITSMISTAISEISKWSQKAAHHAAQLEIARNDMYVESAKKPGGKKAAAARRRVEKENSLMEMCKQFMQQSSEQRDTALTLLQTAGRKPQVG